VDTAVSIALASDPPLPGLEPGETAALFLALAEFESGYNPNALGDCTPGKPKSVATCQSLGLFQISGAHAPRPELLVSGLAALHARRLLETSMRICRKEAPARRLAWYAQGGEGCSPKGFVKSEHRTGLAQRLWREAPLPEEGD
jgi:hypothetical protein